MLVSSMVCLLKRLGLVIIIFTMSALSKPMVAEAQTIFGAVPEALGDTGRAAVNAIDSHFLNPAALAYTHDYNIGMLFQEAGLSSDSPLNNYSVVITDNSTDKLAAAGMAYVTKRTSFPGYTVLDQDFSFDIATILTPQISIGFQGHRLVRQISNSSGFVKHNLTFGALVVPRPFLGLAFVAYDMLNDDDLDMVPVLSLGAHVIIMDILRIRADIARQEKKNPNHSGSLGVGMEVDAGNGFFLRTGGLWNDLTKQTFWSAGIGWEGPRLSAAYAYKTDVNVSGSGYHTFQAWVNF